MVKDIIALCVLFFVIFDPPLSLGVFAAATKKMKPQDRQRTALMAVGLAILISSFFLIFGQQVFLFFSTTIADFKIAGGIVWGILGLHMILGLSTQNLEKTPHKSAAGVAAIIATPLLTGPAAITAIIISAEEYGRASTGIAMAIILSLTALILLFTEKITRFIPPTAIRVISTILGLITLSWGIGFIRAELI